MLHDMNNVILIITFAVNVALAAYLTARDRKNATNISYSMLLLCLAAWAISFVFWDAAVNPSWIKFWIGINFFSTIFVAAFLLYFSLIFPKADFIRAKTVLFAIFLPAFVFGAVSFTDLIAEGISPPYIEPAHGQWYLLFAAYLIAYISYSLYIILTKYIMSKGREKLQLQYLMIGFFVTSIVSVLANVILVSKGMVTLGPVMMNTFGPASTLVAAAFTTYAIVKHKLLGIDDFFLRGTFFVWGAFLAVGSVNIIVSGHAQFLVPFNVILAAVALGFYILFLNIKNEINRSFFALSLCLALWMYAALNFAYSTSLLDAIYWGKLAFVGPILIPSIFYFFTSVFPRKIKKLSSYQMGLMFILPLAALAVLPTDLILKGVVFTDGYPSPVFGMGYNLIIAYFLAYVGYGVANMIGKYNAFVGAEKMQSRYLLLGVSLSAVFASITSIVLPWIGESKLVAHGPLFTIMFIVTCAYAIGVARLLSIEFMMQKGLIHLLISTILTMLYLLVGFISGQSPTAIFEHKTLIAAMLFALFASLIYQPVYGFIQKYSDRLFYGGKYDYRKTLLNISQGITLVMKLSELIGLIVSTFLNTIKVKEISVLLFNESKNKFKSVPCDIKTSGRYKRIEFDAGGHIASWLSANKGILVRDELEGEIEKYSSLWLERGLLSELQDLRDELSKLGMAVWIPVISKGKLIAIICLGYKQSGDMYTDEDIGLLKTLANQVAVAVENSIMYSTISKQYEELKLTKDKLSEADKLASLGTMAAGMAHEIKNPLSSMKVFSQLLHERYQDAEFRGKFEEIIPKEISRIDRIVEGLLSFAKSPEPQLSQVSIQELLEEILSDIKGDIERNGINIVKRFAEVPAVQADRDQIARAFSNIILNAVQSMPSGGELILDVSAVNKPSKSVVVKIIDKGHGISKEHLKHIFDPFFTTKHYGTGLGLTISHSIIDKHKGTTDIQSEPDKGTTVIITLPASQ
ncbi:MAG: ATP-binding protein [bacterium]